MVRIPPLLKVMTGLISFCTPTNTSHSRSSVPKMRTENDDHPPQLPFFSVILSLSIM